MTIKMLFIGKKCFIKHMSEKPICSLDLLEFRKLPQISGITSNLVPATSSRRISRADTFGAEKTRLRPINLIKPARNYQTKLMTNKCTMIPLSGQLTDKQNIVSHIPHQISSEMPGCFENVSSVVRIEIPFSH
jgi:hypothetical protein